MADQASKADQGSAIAVFGTGLAVTPQQQIAAHERSHCQDKGDDTGNKVSQAQAGPA
jgi:hypothetical protein